MHCPAAPVKQIVHYEPYHIHFSDVLDHCDSFYFPFCGLVAFEVDEVAAHVCGLVAPEVAVVEVIDGADV